MSRNKKGNFLIKDMECKFLRFSFLAHVCIEIEYAILNVFKLIAEQHWRAITLLLTFLMV